MKELLQISYDNPAWQDGWDSACQSIERGYPTINGDGLAVSAFRYSRILHQASAPEPEGMLSAYWLLGYLARVAQ